MIKLHKNVTVHDYYFNEELAFESHNNFEH